MAYRALYSYAWDIADAGVAEFVAETKRRHINTVSVAAAYHAGKFLRPHGRVGRVLFPEDGTVTFRHDPARYGEIRPVENSLVAKEDVLAALCGAPHIDVNAWLVLMHNSRLGAAHPQATVMNAFGDRYVYSLCPSSPAARTFATALCADLTERYPVTGLSLETPGFLPYAHGYHHEFTLVRPNAWLDRMLGLCFCPSCVARAGDAGLDAEGIRQRVATAVEAYLSGDVDWPEDMAEAFFLADVVGDPDLTAFLQWRCTVVTSLVAEIRSAVRDDVAIAVIPSVARPTAGAWYEGSDLPALAGVAGRIEVCLYEPGPARIRADLADIQRRLAGAGGLRAILRPGYPDLDSRQQVIDAVAAVAAAGVVDIAFYNYGHLRTASLDWMSDALAAIESGP